MHVEKGLFSFALSSKEKEETWLHCATHGFEVRPDIGDHAGDAPSPMVSVYSPQVDCWVFADTTRGRSAVCLKNFLSPLFCLICGRLRSKITFRLQLRKCWKSVQMGLFSCASGRIQLGGRCDSFARIAKHDSTCCLEDRLNLHSRHLWNESIHLGATTSIRWCNFSLRPKGQSVILQTL